MIGYPKEEYEALFHNKPDLYFKGYDEAWNILSKNVYETIANKASGYETVIQMPTRKGKRWTKIQIGFIVEKSFIFFFGVTYHIVIEVICP